MVNNPGRTLYEIVGVHCGATEEEIRSAYLLRVRVLQPDRFDRTNQSAEWELANELLRELNAAFAVLVDPVRRASYDASRFSPSACTAQTDAKPMPKKAQEGEQRGGQASPARTQANRWLRRLPALTLGAVVVIAVIATGYAFCKANTHVAKSESPAVLPATSPPSVNPNAVLDKFLAELQKRARTAQTVELDPMEIDPPRPVPAADPCASLSDRHNPDRPVNGQEYGRTSETAGYGKLTIVNGNEEDAAVLLASIDGATEDRLMYVRAGTTATMDKVAPGKYRRVYQVGKNWNEATEMFSCITGTAQFDRLALFEEEYTDRSIRYTEIRTTLHRVSEGNVTATAVPASVFRRRSKQ